MISFFNYVIIRQNIKPCKKHGIDLKVPFGIYILKQIKIDYVEVKFGLSNPNLFIFCEIWQRFLKRFTFEYICIDCQLCVQVKTSYKNENFLVSKN